MFKPRVFGHERIKEIAVGILQFRQFLELQRVGRAADARPRKRAQDATLLAIRDCPGSNRAGVHHAQFAASAKRHFVQAVFGDI